MKANRRFRSGEDAGAEVIGAIILFGVFVATIALLNITAVPQAGLAAEEEHVRRVLDGLNNLQLEAESAGTPGKAGATVGRSLQMSPDRAVGQDFFSFFLATPARASGQITFERDYGEVTLMHWRGLPTPVYDVGGASGGVAAGRVQFDPNPVFREPGVIQLENGGVVTTSRDTATMRFAPPITVTNDSGVHHVSVKTRILNGTDASFGGTGTLRVSLLAEVATLAASTTPNANSTVLVLHTQHGRAWQSYLNATSEAAGLAPRAPGAAGPEVGYHTELWRGDGTRAKPDVVTWWVFGADSTETGGAYVARDVRLTSGIAVYSVSVG